jgi:hypothetical protein
VEAVNGTAGLAYFTFTGTDLHYNILFQILYACIITTDESTVTKSAHAQILFEGTNKDGDVGK